MNIIIMVIKSSQIEFEMRQKILLPFCISVIIKARYFSQLQKKSHRIFSLIIFSGSSKDDQIPFWLE